MSFGLKRVQEPTYAYRILNESEVTVTTAGTPVLCPSNTFANAVRIINNNAVAKIAVGLVGTVDALATPKIGIVLLENESVVIHVRSNSNEIAIDSDTSAAKVTVQILGV